MATVPQNNVIPFAGTRPSDTHLLMALAIMHEMGKFGKPTTPTVDKLKDAEKIMEGTQRFQDYLKGNGKDEGLEREVKEQNI